MDAKEQFQSRPVRADRGAGLGVMLLAGMILIVPLLGAKGASSQQAAPERPETAKAVPATGTVEGLLEAWRASEKQRERFTLAYEQVSDGDELYHHPQYAARSGKRTFYSRGEVRYDGARIFFSNIQWAKSANENLAIPKDQPKKRAWLWDGRVYYFYTPGVSVVVNPGHGDQNVHLIVPTAVIRGHVCDMSETVDVAVRRSESHRLRPKPERIGGCPCAVIEASGKEGRQTLWIDTQRGNSLVKAEVHLTAGDMLNGKPIEKGYRYDVTLSKVHLQQINGVWFPTNFTYDVSERFPDGHIRTHTENKFSEIKVNPDFDAIRAFVPTMIADGERVRFIGSKRKQYYTWQKGEVLDEAGRKVEF